MSDDATNVPKIEKEYDSLQSALKQRDAVAADQAHHALMSDLQSVADPQSAYLKIKQDTKGGADLAFVADPDALKLGGITEHQYRDLMSSNAKEVALAKIDAQWSHDGHDSVQQSVKNDVAMFSDKEFGFLDPNVRQGFDAHLREAFRIAGGPGLDAYFNAVSQQINQPDSRFVMEMTSKTTAVPNDPGLQSGEFGAYNLRFRQTQAKMEYKF